MYTNKSIRKYIHLLRTKKKNQSQNKIITSASNKQCTSAAAGLFPQPSPFSVLTLNIQLGGEQNETDWGWLLNIQWQTLHSNKVGEPCSDTLGLKEPAN